MSQSRKQYLEATKGEYRLRADWWRRFLLWLGVCPDCREELAHHLDEPFSSCGCGTGEDTGKPPLLQRLKMWFRKKGE
jgi:hypothetical protein